MKWNINWIPIQTGISQYRSMFLMDLIQPGAQQEDYHQHFPAMEFVDLMATEAFHQPIGNQCLHLLQSSQPGVHFLLWLVGLIAVRQCRFSRYREKLTDQIYFVICNSCYWCATYFGINVSLSSPLVCHGCGLYNTELMPISTDESFRIDYSPKRGMELEFYR